MSRIERLTHKQEGQILPHVEKWIRIGLSTEPADWEKAERALARIYSLAGLGRVPIIRVPSPLVGALAAPIAPVVIANLRGDGKESPAVRSAVRSAVGSAVHSAVDSAVHSAVDSAVDSAVHSAVHSAVDSAVRSAVDSAVDSAVRSAVDSAVDSAVRSAVDSAVYSAVHSAVDSAVRSAVDSAVRSAVHSAVGSAVYSAVGSAVYSAVDSAADSAVDSAVRSAVDSAVRSAVDSAVYSAVHSAVDSAVRSAVGSAVRSAVRSAVCWHEWIGGALWPGYPSWYGFMEEVLGVDIPEIGKAYAEVAQAAGYWWPNKSFLMVCDRPAGIHRDTMGRLHNETGQSIHWRDGWGLWHWHGVAVEKRVVESPEKITVGEIEGEENVEVRRVKMERYGWERYLLDSGAHVIDASRWGMLYHKEIGGDEPLMAVRVLNATPEEDGERKTYMLRVPPTVQTAQEAVAWTFGMRGDEYAPEKES